MRSRCQRKPWILVERIDSAQDARASYPASRPPETRRKRLAIWLVIIVMEIIGITQRFVKAYTKNQDSKSLLQRKIFFFN